MQRIDPESALRAAIGSRTTIHDHARVDTPERGIFRGCEHCSGGIVPAATDTGRWRVCACVRQRLWAELVAPAIGIEPRYVDVTVEALDTAQKQTLVKRALRGDSLCLSGAAGRGKTHLAHVIMREWFRARLESAVLSGMLGGAKCWECAGIGCPECNGIGIIPMWQHFGTAPALPEYVTRMIARASCADGGNDIEVAKLHLRSLWDHRLLILDEFGPRMKFDWFAEAMFALVDHRYNNRLQTIICTNLTPADMASADSMARIHSRLSELRAFAPISGADRRMDTRGAK